MANLNRRHPETGRRVYDAIMASIQSHAQFPLTGQQRDDLLPGLRSFAVSDHVVVFRPFKYTIEVLRVLYGRRNIQRIIREETEI